MELWFVRYLNDKYLSDFQMIDESGYWETGDESIMQANFKKYDALLDNFIPPLYLYLTPFQFLQ